MPSPLIQHSTKSIFWSLTLLIMLGCQAPKSEPVSPRFNHVYLVVADLDRSVAFYTQAFDLTETKRISKIKRTTADGESTEFDVNMALLKFDGQDFVLEISERASYKAVNDSSSFNHLGIDVADIDAAEQRLLNAGAKLMRGVTLVEADDIAAKNSFYLGPDGETIELMQLLKGEF